MITAGPFRVTVCVPCKLIHPLGLEVCPKCGGQLFPALVDLEVGHVQVIGPKEEEARSGEAQAD